jgi:hypothetical protein
MEPENTIISMWGSTKFLEVKKGSSYLKQFGNHWFNTYVAYITVISGRKRKATYGKIEGNYKLSEL